MNLIKKIHIYAGLLCFTQLIVYGIAGLGASAQTALERPKTVRSMQYVPYRPGPSMTDKDVASDVYRLLALPLTRPVPDWFLQHTPDNHLQLDFYHINGLYRVVVLEQEGRLRIEEIRNSLPLFLQDIHAATLGDTEVPRLVQWWAVWNEAGMWALLMFCASGVVLWLISRPGLIWPYVTLGISGAALGGLWAVFR